MRSGVLALLARLPGVAGWLELRAAGSAMLLPPLGTRRWRSAWLLLFFRALIPPPALVFMVSRGKGLKGSCRWSIAASDDEGDSTCCSAACSPRALSTDVGDTVSDELELALQI
jgi:hypothetical protein